MNAEKMNAKEEHASVAMMSDNSDDNEDNKDTNYQGGKTQAEEEELNNNSTPSSFSVTSVTITAAPRPSDVSTIGSEISTGSAKPKNNNNIARFFRPADGHTVNLPAYIARYVKDDHVTFRRWPVGEEGAVAFTLDQQGYIVTEEKTFPLPSGSSEVCQAIAKLVQACHKRWYDGLMVWFVATQYAHVTLFFAKDQVAELRKDANNIVNTKLWYCSKYDTWNRETHVGKAQALNQKKDPTTLSVLYRCVHPGERTMRFKNTHACKTHGICSEEMKCPEGVDLHSWVHNQVVGVMLGIRTKSLLETLTEAELEASTIREFEQKMQSRDLKLLSLKVDTQNPVKEEDFLTCDICGIGEEYDGQDEAGFVVKQTGTKSSTKTTGYIFRDRYTWGTKVVYCHLGFPFHHFFTDKIATQYAPKGISKTKKLGTRGQRLQKFISVSLERQDSFTSLPHRTNAENKLLPRIPNQTQDAPFSPKAKKTLLHQVGSQSSTAQSTGTSAPAHTPESQPSGHKRTQTPAASNVVKRPQQANATSTTATSTVAKTPAASTEAKRPQQANATSTTATQPPPKTLTPTTTQSTGTSKNEEPARTSKPQPSEPKRTQTPAVSPEAKRPQQANVTSTTATQPPQVLAPKHKDDPIPPSNYCRVCRDLKGGVVKPCAFCGHEVHSICYHKIVDYTTNPADSRTTSKTLTLVCHSCCGYGRLVQNETKELNVTAKSLVLPPCVDTLVIHCKDHTAQAPSSPQALQDLLPTIFGEDYKTTCGRWPGTYLHQLQKKLCSFDALDTPTIYAIRNIRKIDHDTFFSGCVAWIDGQLACPFLTGKKVLPVELGHVIFDMACCIAAVGAIQELLGCDHYRHTRTKDAQDLVQSYYENGVLNHPALILAPTAKPPMKKKKTRNKKVNDTPASAFDGLDKVIEKRQKESA
ncbi:unknown protein [Seminavis robusta]|uniref:Uncharacterized protein n=1 Tax=Seminavis robusta TaxID=568900 RepID=A0A9N8EDQ0_9STRA|nr:unknown protein [Seminavis robusta]|eukprot:Sro1001_g229800.1 n/a (924) ;mRNA; f:12861-15700